MYVTASQLTIHNEFKTDVREGGIAAIGPQSEVRVGQSSAVTTGLVLDFIVIVRPCHVYFRLKVNRIFLASFSKFLNFRSLETTVGGMLVSVFNMRMSVSEWFERTLI